MSPWAAVSTLAVALLIQEGLWYELRCAPCLYAGVLGIVCRQGEPQLDSGLMNACAFCRNPNPVEVCISHVSRMIQEFVLSSATLTSIHLPEQLACSDSTTPLQKALILRGLYKWAHTMEEPQTCQVLLDMIRKVWLSFTTTVSRSVLLSTLFSQGHHATASHSFPLELSLGSLIGTCARVLSVSEYHISCIQALYMMNDVASQPSVSGRGLNVTHFRCTSSSQIHMLLSSMISNLILGNVMHADRHRGMLSWRPGQDLLHTAAP